MKKYVLLLLMVLLGACQRSVIQGDDEREGVSVAVRLSLSAAPMGEVEVKATDAGIAGERAIKSVYVLVYRGGALRSFKYFPTWSSGQIMCLTGKGQNIYVVANLADGSLITEANSVSEAEFKKKVATMAAGTEVVDNGMLMFGKLLNQDITTTYTLSSMSLERLSAKVSLTVNLGSGATAAGYKLTLKSFDVYSVPTKSGIFDAATDWAAPGFINRTTLPFSGVACEFYMFENRKGGAVAITTPAPSGVTLSPANPKHKWNYRPVGASYVVIKADYTLSGQPPLAVEYKIPLGEFSPVNFNITRNTWYKYTITVNGITNNDVDVTVAKYDGRANVAAALWLSSSAPEETVSFEGKAYKTTVTATRAWTTTPSAGVTITPTTGGTGSTEVTITVGENKEDAARTVSAIFSSTLGSQTATWSGLQQKELPFVSGNLVADGANGCKIGGATDDGLLFQWGSLIGWNSPAAGGLAIVVRPKGYTATPGWSACPRSSNSIGADNATAGTGDPCHYYLGAAYRLPTKADFVSLNSAGSTWSAPYRIFGGKITLGAVGYRDNSGSATGVGAYGYYWSSTPCDASDAYNMSFGESDVGPESRNDVAFGLSVRCVAAALWLSSSAPEETVPFGGKAYKTTVTATRAWTTTPSAGVTITPTAGGEGETTVTITVAANPAAVLRNLTATFTQTSNSETATWSGLQQASPPITPVGTADWFEGNLVADGANGCKIGGATDDGLVFQWGSLIGWSSPAAGDPATIVVRPKGYTATPGWSACPHSSNSIGADNATAGTGDPCHYYLGAAYRLPTRADFESLKSADAAASGEWSSSNYGYYTFGGKITLRAVGYRASNNSNTSYVGERGFYWSSTYNDANVAYGTYFNKWGFDPGSSSNTSYGFSVRCVKNR